MKTSLKVGFWFMLATATSSCSSMPRLPASADAIDSAPEALVAGREAYAELSRFAIALDDSHQRHLQFQISEIGVIHTEESELSSWKFNCIRRQALEIHSSLAELGSPGRKEIEALHVEGIDLLLADLSEHPEASPQPSLRLMWWESGEGRGVSVRAVYDPQNPDPARRCRILKAGAFERQLHQVR